MKKKEFYRTVVSSKQFSGQAEEIFVYAHNVSQAEKRAIAICKDEKRFGEMEDLYVRSVEIEGYVYV